MRPLLLDGNQSGDTVADLGADYRPRPFFDKQLERFDTHKELLIVACARECDGAIAQLQAEAGDVELGQRHVAEDASVRIFKDCQRGRELVGAERLRFFGLAPYDATQSVIVQEQRRV